MNWEFWNTCSTYFAYVCVLYFGLVVVARFFRKYTLSKRMSPGGDVGIPIMMGIMALFGLLFNLAEDPINEPLPTTFMIIFVGTSCTIGASIYYLVKGISKLRSKFPAC